MTEIKNKTIYLSDCYDVKLLDKIFGQFKYTVFDKAKLLPKFGVGHFTGIDNSPSKSHLFRLEAKSLLLKSIKNKKHKNIIYLLYKSDPNNIMDLLKSDVQPELKTITLDFSLLSPTFYKNWTGTQIDVSDYEDEN